MKSQPTYQQDGCDCGEQGFTLVELIASLVIMAVVMALLGSSVHTLASSWDRQISRLDQSDIVARSIAVFRRDLQAIRHLSMGSPQSQKLAFIGGTRTITFVSGAAQQPTGRDLAVINYTFERKRNSIQLIRRTGQFNAGSPLTNIALRNPVVMFDKLAKASLSYHSTSKQTKKWTSRWSDDASLPNLIRLRLSFKSSHRLPAIITRVRSEIDQKCIVSDADQCSTTAGSNQTKNDQTKNREPAR